MYHILVLFIHVTLTVGGRSANSDYVKKLVRHADFGTKITDSLMEDVFLDAAGLATKYGYPFEEYSVTTEDGYILCLHRIPHGREKPNTPGTRPAVLIMHGLFLSSVDFLVTGPGKALAYILADAGFDVWLGNARGNYYSRKHILLNPDNRRGSFWDFSWDEIGNLDLPAIIDYILLRTHLPSIHYIGMSQGTTSYFVMGSMRPDYNSKITTMHALAPVAYMGHTTCLIYIKLAQHAESITRIFLLLGLKEIMPKSILIRWIGLHMCHDGALFQPLCSAIVFSTSGWTPNQFNSTMFPVKLGHAPAGGSLYQAVHYGQCIVNNDFRRYDYGSRINQLKYGSLTPPKYNLSQVTAPVFLYYSTSDPVATVKDVNRLAGELGGPVTKTMFPVKLGHAPAGGSLYQAVHYGQCIVNNDFRRCDYGSRINQLKYGSLTPPKYNLSQVTAPVFLYYSTSDPVATVKDVNRLAGELGGPVTKVRLSKNRFSHIDFLWGIDVKNLVYDHVIDIMKRFELNHLI